MTSDDAGSAAAAATLQRRMRDAHVHAKALVLEATTAAYEQVSFGLTWGGADWVVSVQQKERTNQHA